MILTNKPEDAAEIANLTSIGCRCAISHQPLKAPVFWWVSDGGHLCINADAFGNCGHSSIDLSLQFLREVAELVVHVNHLNRMPDAPNIGYPF